MGLSNVSYGLYGGVVAFAVPQLLGDRHVPEEAIAGLSAAAFSPGFWAFLFSPVLDVRFSRRWYAVTLAIVAAINLIVAFLNLGHLVLLETVLTIGFIGALGTLGLTLLPHTPTSYATVLTLENLFQSLAITTSIAVILETIGRENPLASTTFCFISSAYGVPISYMIYVDAFGFDHGGITGSLLIDAMSGIIASVLLGFMLFWRSGRPKMLAAWHKE